MSRFDEYCGEFKSSQCNQKIERNIAGLRDEIDKKGLGIGTKIEE